MRPVVVIIPEIELRLSKKSLAALSNRNQVSPFGSLGRPLFLCDPEDLISLWSSFVYASTTNVLHE